MKFVMYHYVRPESPQFPHFRTLHLDDFRQQLDYFERTSGFVCRREFENALAGGPVARGIVLTFDDGLLDHYQFVFPELRQRGLWGIFYIPTGQYHARRLLGVHRIHCLLGKFGGVKMIDAVRSVIRPEMLVHAHVDSFRKLTYARQENDAATTEFKRIFNYYVATEWREKLLDQLMNESFDELQLCSEFYVREAHLREMQDAGMVIGGHGVTHQVFANLSEKLQRQEIRECFEFLENVTCGLRERTFCFPYGGDHSFNQTTLQILRDEGCAYALSVEPRDAETIDFREQLLKLPRYDCNQFPFGKVRTSVEKGT